jgi:phenylalanine-4-hydroxylase
MKATLHSFTDADQEVWRRLYAGTERCRREQAHPDFCDGLEKLGIGPDRIPALADVNARLKALTGWQGVFVEGLEDAGAFFRGLARREFPVGAFIRSANDLAYTPAPDVFHDMYGHLPLLANRNYADFCAEFGARAALYTDDPVRLKAFETFFWFGVEFPLIKTEQGLRIFGGGILSSRYESDYCLSEKPEKRAFDCHAMGRTPYRIDQVQPVLFVLSAPEQLFSSLDAFEEGLA